MRYLGLVVLAALVVATGATAAAQKGGSLHATLTGKAETPKGDPDGRGTAEVTITGRRVCWEIKVSKVQTIMAAHIHKGKPGTAGPVVVPFGKSFKAKGCTTTTAAIAAAIQRNPGRVLRERPQREVPGRRPARAAPRNA